MHTLTSFFSEDVSLLIIAIESLKGHLCFSVCTLLCRQSSSSSIQPFVGRWAEPSEFPSPANCPWISFGISKRHQWASKAFLYHRDTKMRRCRDESTLIITPLNLTSLLFTHWHAKFFSHVSRASLKSAPKVPEDVVWCGRPAMMMMVSANERNWPLTSHYYVIT